MKQFRFTQLFLILAISTSFVFSCKDNKEKAVTPSTTSDSEKMDTTTVQDTIKITLNSNDQMQYDKSEITVSEGQTVILTLHHTGTMPVEAMGHNFVLLTKGTVIGDFGVKAMEAKDNGYIPTDKSNIIANTELIGGGETTSITFKAPQKGTYDFICSFPGHYALMKGKFIVK